MQQQMDGSKYRPEIDAKTDARSRSQLRFGVSVLTFFMAKKQPTDDFPYKTYLNILHGPLELIDMQELADACTDKWYNQTLCQVNDSVVRLAVVEGEYHWHEHSDIDEFFYVIEGEFIIDLQDRTVELKPQQGFVVPRRVQHRTRALRRTVILMVERADIIPTGD
jgi:mannose-6-phosphate isomerase-like protein (cupin superfamily)